MDSVPFTVVAAYSVGWGIPYSSEAARYASGSAGAGPTAPAAAMCCGWGEGKSMECIDLLCSSEMPL